MLRVLFNRVPIWLIVAAVVIVVGSMSLAQEAGNPVPAAGGAAVEGGGDKTETVSTPEISFLGLLEAGGLQFMIPIGLCSLLGVTIIIERSISLRRRAIIPRAFMPGLKSVFHHDGGDRTAGLDYCRANGSPISRVVAAAIRKLHKPQETVERAIEDAGGIEVLRLRRFLRLLYGVSAIAPMIGLLGTVWGMIKAFQVAAVAGLGKAGLLAEGIYIALVTTLAGLVVAIPVLMFYYYFQGKIDDVVHEMNDVTMDFLDHYIAEEDELASAPVRTRAAEPATVAAAAGNTGRDDWSQD
ncbi:MAG: MotA/TolQ/ExbB proton channel family protein [Phycisphaerae bacterium]|jgi:biopolymer transport protein ExbB|nr:MotA/TolQ/ExbB proton channel family protein [Phycisphaerae bacterium]